MDDNQSDASPLLNIFETSFSPKPVTIGLKCLLFGINVANIVLGAIYFHDCPGQYLIPYYLIISGAAGILFLCLTCLPCGDGREPPTTSLPTLCAQGLMILFMFAFFITGNVWIYSLYNEPWDSPTDPKRCNRVLFLYAFWITNVSYMFIAILILVYLCLLAFLCIMRRVISP
ncbi:transmembrane protein 272-like [Pyxicephalus adspersus]|uniref:transmembrane protein 272-like n=1 Tax=Pyxicephalus adspersus TaxID=30357 RepID=UPI003B5C697C